MTTQGGHNFFGRNKINGIVKVLKFFKYDLKQINKVNQQLTEDSFHPIGTLVKWPGPNGEHALCTITNYNKKKQNYWISLLNSNEVIKAKPSSLTSLKSLTL